jgi:hypothetical protein
VVEHLPSKCEVLSSNPSITKKCFTKTVCTGGRSRQTDEWNRIENPDSRSKNKLDIDSNKSS